MTNCDLHLLYSHPFCPSVMYKKIVDLGHPLNDNILIVLAIKIAVSFLLRGSLDDLYKFISVNSQWISDVIETDFVYYHPKNTIIDNCGLRWVTNCFQSEYNIERHRETLHKWNNYMQSIYLGDRISLCFPLGDSGVHYNRFLDICHALIDGTFHL
jgi:hypothetical protein